MNAKLQQQMQVELKPIYEEMAKIINAQLNQLQYEKAISLSEKAVQIFHDNFTYAEGGYLPTGQIATFIHPEIRGNDFILQIGSEFGQGNYRAPIDYIYKLVFLSGYHGGAYKGPFHPHPGIPYYRGPMSNDIVARFSYWTRPAVQTESPFSIFSTLWNNYLNGEYEQEKQRIINEVIKDYLQTLADIVIKYREINYKISSVKIIK